VTAVSAVAFHPEEAAQPVGRQAEVANHIEVVEQRPGDRLKRPLPRQLRYSEYIKGIPV
jgi:hypothetical protein